jgi:hypothetical protein
VDIRGLVSLAPSAAAAAAAGLAGPRSLPPPAVLLRLKPSPGAALSAHQVRESQLLSDGSLTAL